jgi:hypothetical protein
MRTQEADIMNIISASYGLDLWGIDNLSVCNVCLVQTLNWPMFGYQQLMHGKLQLTPCSLRHLTNASPARPIQKMTHEWRAGDPVPPGHDAAVATREYTGASIRLD